MPAGAILLADHQTVQLNAAALTCDVVQFDAALHSAARSSTGSERRQRLVESVTLYQGEFLPGCFEEWVLQERLRLAEAFFQAARQLIAALEQAGDRQGALQMARQAARVDPLREETARDLMRLIAAQDEPEAALRHYAQLERLLEQELGAAPEEKTRALAHELARQSASLPTRAAGRSGASGRLRSPLWRLIRPPRSPRAP